MNSQVEVLKESEIDEPIGRSVASFIPISQRVLFNGALLTIGAYGFGQGLRLITNVILARLLAPELFGIMQIVYSFRTGVELISDVGIGQNIIYNARANEPDFYNTAWTLQVVRGLLLWVIFCIAAVPIAHFYHTPILAPVIPIAAFAILLGALASTNRFLLQKRMLFRRLTIFEALVATVASLAQLAWSYFDPTLWSLVFGPLVGIATMAAGSHLLLPGIRQRFQIIRRYAKEILSFGKWIFVSSIVFFLATNLDRLYLAKTIPLTILGVYGIARALSELASTTILHLGNSVIFPYVASQARGSRHELRSEIAPLRLKFLLVVGAGFSLFAATSDLAIHLLYDQRYQAASWMLPILLSGAWFAVLANINEATLLGLGRPNFSALANAGKLGALLLGLLYGVSRYGVVGGILAVAIADACRYIPILVGQIREQLSYFKQDVLATLAVIALIVLWEIMRQAAGFRTSFASFPWADFACHSCAR